MDGYIIKHSTSTPPDTTESNDDTDTEGENTDGESGTDETETDIATAPDVILSPGEIKYFKVKSLMNFQWLLD